MNNFKAAAIWCRVSTHDQRELSLDSQEVAVQKVLEAQGYQAPPQYVLKVDWTSLDLMGCPRASSGWCSSRSARSGASGWSRYRECRCWRVVKGSWWSWRWPWGRRSRCYGRSRGRGTASGTGRYSRDSRRPWPRPSA